MRHSGYNQGDLLRKIKVSFDEPLSKHTSLSIGGPARVFAAPSTLEELKEAMAEWSGMPVRWLGGGTNVLAGDGPMDALVISTVNMRGIEVLSDNVTGAVLRVSCGEPLKKLLSFCLERGLSGLEGLVGIPGTFGGAVKGNSGAHGLEMKDVVFSVCVMDKKGQVQRLNREEIGFKYRGSAINDPTLIVNADLALSKGKNSTEQIKKKMNEFFAMKRHTQPLAQKSAGCVFKNPPGNSAGRLIDQAGLKGARIGDIAVSTVHANFFVNLGKGSSSDFLALMELVSRKVKEQAGITLSPEIRILKNAGNK